MHRNRPFLTLRSLRLCVGISHARTPSPQRTFPFLFSFLAIAFSLAPLAFGQSTGGAKGKIRDLKGEAIAGVSVTARRDSKDIRTVTSGQKGEFTIDSLAPGVYNFAFDAKGYASAVRYNIEIRSNKTADLGDRLILRVDRGTLVIVQGSVFFKDGKSVTGAKVEPERVNADGTTRSYPAVYTNIYGEFNFRQPEGAAKYRFTVKYNDKTASKEVDVDNAAIYRLAIHLDAARSDK